MNGVAIKNTTKRTNRTGTTPGFTFRIEETTELSDVFLIAEFDGGRYEPLGGVISLREAKEFADNDLHCRMRDLEAGKEPACPDGYVVWARGIDGTYAAAFVYRPQKQ